MKKNLKRFIAWVIVIVSLLSACFLPSLTQIAFAENTAAGQNAINYMKQAAKVQAVVSVFDDCVGGSIYMGGNTGEGAGGSWQLYDGRMAYRTVNSGADFWNEYHYHYLFDANKYEYSTGAWLENDVQGKVDNGGIWCRNNDEHILDVFASTLGLSSWQNNVICDGNQPGLMKMLVKSGDSWVEVQGQCQMGLGNDDYIFFLRSKDDAINYVKTLYERYKANNPGVAIYLPAWDDIHSWDDLLIYNLYMDDFVTACTDGSVYSGPANAVNTDNYWGVKTVDAATGELVTTYYHKNIVKENWDKSIFGSSGAHTCTDIVSSINSRADAILAEWQKVQDEEKKKQEQAIRETCYTTAEERYSAFNSVLIQIANMLRGGAYKEGTAEYEKLIADQIAIQDVMMKIQTMLNNGTYWEERSDGIYCAELPSVEGVTIDTDDPEGPVYTPPEVEPPSSDSPSNTDTDQPYACFTAAGSLGWILCPVLETLGNATQGLYDAVIKPFLEIDADFLQMGNSVNDGWANFRNLANILFAIAFVIVILAQITGIGISNYNVKKILPRLIMVVVLVNLSFIICQLAVDVSNILGESLYKLFMGMAGGVDMATSSPSSVGGIVGTILGLLFAGGIGVAAIGTWELWLIPLLLALLGCVISVIFFFIILAVRQAGIIVLIVLSPIAIICYALPNTKSFFDRWRKLLTSLLVVYPVCGILLGGGVYVSDLLIGTGKTEPFFLIAAMLVQVVPFFMIPSIVKGSMSAMGNLGTKIAGFGQRFGRWGQGRIRDSRTFQEGQQERLRRNNMRRDERLALRNQRIARELGARERNGETLSARDQRRLYNARYRLDRHRRGFESQAMADVQNRYNAERDLMTEGSERYENYDRAARSRVENETFNTELQGFSDELENNTFRLGDEIINSSDMDDLDRAHVAALRDSTDAHATEDQRRTARARAAAIEERMMKLKDDDAVDRITSNYLSQSRQAGSRDSDSGRSFMRATDRFTTAYGAQVNRYGGKGIARAMGALSRGDFDQVSGHYQDREFTVPYTNSRGENTTRTIQYNRDDLHSTIQSLTAQGLNDLSDDNFARIRHAIQNGDLGERDIATLSRVFNEYRNNDQIAKKESKLSSIDEISSSMASSSSAVTDNNGNMVDINNADNTSLGAEAVRNMSTEQREELANQLDSTDWAALSSGNANDATNNVQSRINMLANAQYALQHYGNSMTLDEFSHLNSAFNRAYQSMNNIDSTVATRIDRSRLDNVYNHLQGEDRRKLESGENIVFRPGRDGSTSAPSTIDMPTNWQNIDGVWYDTNRPINTINSNGAIVGGYERLNPDQIADAELITRHNAQARFDARRRQQRNGRQRNNGGGNP